MITIFCGFCQFSAKKMAFFSKTNVMIKIRNIFWRKYFKNHNIGPRYIIRCPSVIDLELGIERRGFDSRLKMALQTFFTCSRSRSR
jgi:hypothetical protein